MFTLLLALTLSLLPQVHSLTVPLPRSASQYSPTKIRVSNIDWYLPSSLVESKIKVAFHEVFHEVTSLEVKPPRSSKRDEGKMNGGSAVVEFNSEAAAAEALTRDTSPWRLSQVIEDEDPIETKPELTPERIILRKDRAARYARQRARRALGIDDLLSCVGEIPIKLNPMSIRDIKWESAPPGVDPASEGGGLKIGSSRAVRKRAAVEAFVTMLSHLRFEDSSTQKLSQLRLADLGSGTGNLAIPLSWATGANVLAVDIYANSLARLLKRVNEAGLEEQISVECQDILEVNLEGIDAVLSLHACGAASDLAMEAAVDKKIPFVISPCCIGKVNVKRWGGGNNGGNAERAGKPKELIYPRSLWLRDKIDIDQFQLLAKAADAADGAGDSGSEWFQRGRRAKAVIESDRLMWARERGYEVEMLEMPKHEGYGKTELLVGVPKINK